MRHLFEECIFSAKTIGATPALIHTRLLSWWQVSSGKKWEGTRPTLLDSADYPPQYDIKENWNITLVVNLCIKGVLQRSNERNLVSKRQAKKIKSLTSPPRLVLVTPKPWTPYFAASTTADGVYGGLTAIIKSGRRTKVTAEKSVMANSDAAAIAYWSGLVQPAVTPVDSEAGVQPTARHIHQVSDNTTLGPAAITASP